LITLLKRVPLHVWDPLEETAEDKTDAHRDRFLGLDMEVAEEGSSDSEEVVFFNSEQKGSTAERQKLKVEVLARRNKAEEVELAGQSKSNGRKDFSVEGANLLVQSKRSLKQKVNQNLRRCETSKKAYDSGVGVHPEKLLPVTAISESLLDDSLEFAKRFNADVNFVHAKFAARKPLGLRVEEKMKIKSRSSICRSKLERALLHADIVVIKQSLDIGGAVSARSGGLSTPMTRILSNDSKGERQASKKRKPAPPAGTSDGIYSAAPGCLATVSKAPALEAAVPFKHANPIIPSTSASSMLEGKVKGKPQHGELSKPAAKKVSAVVTKVKPVPMSLRPAVTFPSIKKLSFKIPREKKKPESLAVRVAKLWREAISVDSTGQWCGAKRVSVRKSSRSLLEYESWLKVGKNLDIADWREGGVGQRSRIRASAADPLGLQQLGSSSENLTSRNGSSTVLPYDFLRKQLQEKEEKPRQRPPQITLHTGVNITHHATRWSSSEERLESEVSERLPTLSEHRMSAAVESHENEQDHNRLTEFNVEKGFANSASSSLSGMVGRGRKKLRLGS